MIIERSSQFKRDWKAIKKRGYNMDLIQDVILLLYNKEVLPEKYYDHELRGKYGGYRECHITPDWLLIYKYRENFLILALTATGTHSDLF